MKPQNTDTKKPVDDGRFGDHLRGLRKLQLRLSREKDSEEAVKALQQTERWLREYVEPWQCPDCGWNGKVPEFDADIRRCPMCDCRNCFPYSYLEVERCSKQMSLLLQCTKYYSGRPGIGRVAQDTMKAVNAVRVTGNYGPEDKIPATRPPKKRGWWRRLWR